MCSTRWPDLLSLAPKLSTSLQGEGIQLQVFSEDEKYVVKEWTKERWISPDVAI